MIVKNKTNGKLVSISEKEWNKIPSKSKANFTVMDVVDDVKSEKTQIVKNIAEKKDTKEKPANKSGKK